MDENYNFSLPEPIDLALSPVDWINQFRNQFNEIISDQRGKNWLENRCLKLVYGTRGLSDFGLMDATFAVPPLASTHLHLKDLLQTRGKAGLFAPTGMGKSRIMLYIAHFI